ncbi:hypothetical protein ILUMI_07320 [Ignelater luminosus]|uniref:Probable oligoribonuclease n=1 Tax=Ignelater luminosus TaxID=2038154 RepID=A0A8K0D8C3_IGNLU|nr:hypothetical protein ILUMI_07320 [Ignelater luminosus]
MFKYLIKLGANYGKIGNLFPQFKSFSIMSKTYPGRILWLDMEMSGLDIDRDQIMEVACLVTDGDLNIVAEGPNIIVHQPDSVLDNMNEWCTKQHKQTGLTNESRSSTISLEEAEDQLFEFISKNIAKNSSPIAGNSVYMDRLFLRKHMPRVNNYLHYRIIDVSSIKELCRMWRPEIYKNAPTKHLQHRALTDIIESVEEMKFYRDNFFKLD